MKDTVAKFAAVFIAIVLVILILFFTVITARAQEPLLGVYSLVPNPILGLMDLYDPEEVNCQALECETQHSKDPGGYDVITRSVQLGAVEHPNHPDEEFRVWYVELEYTDPGVDSLNPRYVQFTWSGDEFTFWKEDGQDYQRHTRWNDRYVFNFGTDITFPHMLDRSVTNISTYRHEEDTSWRLLHTISGNGYDNSLVSDFVLKEGASNDAILQVDFSWGQPQLKVFDTEFIDSRFILLMDKVWESKSDPIAYVGTWELRLARSYEIAFWEGTRTPQHLILDEEFDVWPEEAYVYREDGTLHEEIPFSVFAPVALTPNI